MEKKEDKWRKPRSMKDCTLEKIDTIGDVECGKLLHYKNKDTIYRRNKRPILRYFLTMMLM
ncbi:hypothetical protein T12_2088 [Trichinella patagoniensis]|uniref:Uncharacterized protein n=1 Tax=Trichinella patagoniensis TaxID=990121 RepID=A0A0V0Z004_9BILA|nr:hypothetical protein T12_2088 [Trichinella patagoniensis]